MQARVIGSLVSPLLAQELGEESAALDSAKSLLEYGIADLQAVARWSPAELVKHFGTELKLPGVLDATLHRLMDAETAPEGAATE